MRRQRAGDEIQAVGEARLQRLGEYRKAFRQLHAVQPVLHLVVVAAHVDLAKAVLRHAGRAQQHLVEAGIAALGNRGDGFLVEPCHGGAKASLNAAARGIQPFRLHHDFLAGRSLGR